MIGCSISRTVNFTFQTDLQSIEVHAFHAKVAHTSVVDEDWFVAWGFQAYCKGFSMGEADLLHVATGLVPISFSMAIISHDSLTKHKVSLIESGLLRCQKRRSSLRAAHKFILFVRRKRARRWTRRGLERRRQGALTGEAWTRATETGRVDERSMDSGEERRGSLRAGAERRSMDDASRLEESIAAMALYLDCRSFACAIYFLE